MNNSIRVLASLALISLATTLQARAESAPPEDGPGAYIRLDYIQDLLPEYKLAQIDYESFFKQALQVLEEKSKEIKEREEADLDTMPDAVKSQKAQELRKLYYEAAVLQQLLEKKEEELFAPIKNKIQQATAKVAKERGYMFVWKKDESVIYADEACDISDLVLEALGVTLTGEKGEEAISTQKEETTH